MSEQVLRSNSMLFRRVVKLVLRALLARRASRTFVNAVCWFLAFDGYAALHRRAWNLFDDMHPRRFTPGRWTVRFAGRRISVPLTRERLTQDWMVALSVLGVDGPVKRTYQHLLPHVDLFVDVGASYGTHSILFLVHGIDTLSIEPNFTCHRPLRDLCRANGVDPTVSGVAVGDVAGSVELRYPAKSTWLGSVRPRVQEDLGHAEDLVSQRVEQHTLDELLATVGPRRVLIKIDAEGSEVKVLRGAREVLRRRRPYLVFESWPDGPREATFDELGQSGYVVHDVPWRPDVAEASLSKEAFLTSQARDFVAVRADRDLV